MRPEFREETPKKCVTAAIRNCIPHCNISMVIAAAQVQMAQNLFIADIAYILSIRWSRMARQRMLFDSARIKTWASAPIGAANA